MSEHTETPWLNALELERVGVAPSLARNRLLDRFLAYEDSECVEGLERRIGLSDGLSGVALTRTLISELEGGTSGFGLAGRDSILRFAGGCPDGNRSRSFLLGKPGQTYARARDAVVVADHRHLRSSVRDFVVAADDVVGMDVYHGRAGWLLACIALLRRDRVWRAEQVRMDIAARCAAFVEDLLAAVGDGSDVNLNFAHGELGMLYALFAYARLFPESTVHDRLHGAASNALDALCRRLEVTDAERFDEPGEPMTSLCGGYSGQLLFALGVDDVIGSSRSRAAIDGLLTRVSAFQMQEAHLCCGLAGQAFALLAAYRVKRDLRLFERALKLCEAAAIVLERRSSSPALFRGIASIAWFSACIRAGRQPAIPIFET